MSHEPLLPLGYEQTMVAKYQANQSIRMIAGLFGVSPGFVHKVLVRNNVEIRKVGSNLPVATQLKIVEQHGDVRADLTAGMLHAEAARKYKVSREWIRQLAKRWKLPTGREARALRNEQRKLLHANDMCDRKAMRDMSMFARYKVWQDLWDKQMTVPEMATALGLSHKAVSVRISMLRQIYGWFPSRKQIAQSAQPPTIVS